VPGSAPRVRAPPCRCRFSAEQLAGVEAIAMDMWEPYINSARAHLEDADDKIVFDRYHLMKYLTTAVDTVRKTEDRALTAAGDKQLAGSKYLWPYSAENLPARHHDRFALLRAGDLKTARAWASKQSASPLAATATASTSRPPSTSTLAGYSSTHKLTHSPDEPTFVGARIGKNVSEEHQIR